MSSWPNNYVERSIAITRRVASFGVLGMLIISLLTVGDITLRFVFNAPIVGFNEVVEMVMAVAIAATFPAGLAQRVHLKIDLLGGVLSPRTRCWLNPLGSFLLLLIFLVFAWRIGHHAIEVDSIGKTTMILEWRLSPFIWVITALMAVCALIQFVVLLTDIANAFAGFVPPRDFGEKKEQQQLSGRPITPTLFGIVAVLSVAVIAVLNMSLQSVTEFLPSVLPDSKSAIAITFFLIMWVMILALVPLAAAMGLIGLIGTILMVGFEPALGVIGTEVVEFLTNGNLAVLPLFLMMGAFASVAGLSGDIYKLAHVLIGHRRGGLALATIGGCAGFGALTGSSLATAVTIGRVALPEMKERGYSPDLATGCVAAGGTLGQLVPPSSAIVIYAILVEESIGRLFIAAVVPAIIATIFYMITVSLYIRFARKSAPASERPTGAEIWAALRRSWGVIGLFGVVIGGIYGGIFTVNEAAAVGAGGAFMFALFRGKLHRGAIWEVMGETTQTTAMIYALIFGAVTFSFFIGTTGLTGIVTDAIGGLDLHRIAIIFLILLVYLILGAIMDPFALMVITVPIVSPLILDLGYDLVWFGIIMVVVVETGLITPPFGINVFVLKGVAGDVPMPTIFKGVLPFVGADIAKLILLVFFPALILWLPSTMIN